MAEEFLEERELLGLARRRTRLQAPSLKSAYVAVRITVGS
jgi:hypothetical protein